MLLFKFKKLHSWLAIMMAVPLLLIITTGLLLHASPFVKTLQPPTLKGRQAVLKISFAEAISIAAAIPETEIRDGHDVAQIDARPAAGVIRVRAKNFWEVQLDGSTGEVLSSARRWKSILMTLHDGSWFGSIIEYGVVFPAGITLFILWVTGIGLFVLPRLIINKRKRTST